MAMSSSVGYIPVAYFIAVATLQYGDINSKTNLPDFFFVSLFHLILPQLICKARRFFSLSYLQNFRLSDTMLFWMTSEYFLTLSRCSLKIKMSNFRRSNAVKYSN